MIDELRRAMEAAQNAAELLSADEQRRVAQAIEDALENAEWDMLVSTPESQAFLDTLDEEARIAHETGTDRDLDEFLRETLGGSEQSSTEDAHE